MSLEQKLTAAVEIALEAGWNLNQIARESGVGQPQLHKWWTGGGSLNLVNVERLAAHFGMTLTKPKRHTGKP